MIIAVRRGITLSGKTISFPALGGGISSTEDVFFVQSRTYFSHFVNKKLMENFRFPDGTRYADVILDVFLGRLE